MIDACPNCGSKVVSSFKQAGGKATVYRFSCGRRDRHWGTGHMGTINGESEACKEIKRLRAELANEQARIVQIIEALREHGHEKAYDRHLSGTQQGVGLIEMRVLGLLLDKLKEIEHA